jgi:hypothetical protein
MLIFALYTVVLVVVLRKFDFFKTEAISGWGMYLAFGLKLGVALFFYAFPYSTMIDSANYMHDSEALSSIIFESPGDFLKIFFGFGHVQSLNEQYLYTTKYWSHDKGWMYSDTRNVIRVNAIFHWMAFYNERVVLLFNVILCLIGLNWIFKGISNLVAKRKNSLFLLIFFLPSTLLWTANLSKEIFLIIGLGLVFCNTFTNRPHHLKTILGLFIILLFKPYVGVALVFAWIIYIIALQEKIILRWTTLAIFTSVIVSSLFLTRTKIVEHISLKQFDFMNLAEGGVWIELDGHAVRIADEDTMHLEIWEAENKNVYALVKQEVVAEKRVHKQQAEKISIQPSHRDYYVSHRLPKSGSYIPIQPISGQLSNLLTTIPGALFNSFFRPTPLDPPKSAAKWYFVLENYFLLFILSLALTRVNNSENLKLLMFLGVSTILIGLIIGWTTPVLGAIVRYKLPITLSIVAATWLLLFPKIDTQRK